MTEAIIIPADLRHIGLEISASGASGEIAIVLVYQAQNSSPEGLSVPMIARTARPQWHS